MPKGCINKVSIFNLSCFTYFIVSIINKAKRRQVWSLEDISETLSELSNGFKPGQDRHSFCPDLGPNHLQRLSADDNSGHQQEKSVEPF